MLDRHGHRIASLRGIEQPRAELVGRGVEVGAMEDVGGGVRYAWLADPTATLWRCKRCPDHRR